MTEKSNPKIAILSLKNSYKYGGVLTSLKSVYNFCKIHFDPIVFFLGFDHEISTSVKNLKFSSSYRNINYFDMNCIEIGARWGFWEPGNYKYNLKLWEELLKDYKYFLCVSGTCISAHPLALLNKKFGLVMSTPYWQDREERVKHLSGINLYLTRLATPFMKSIEKKILAQTSFIWALSKYTRDSIIKILKYTPENLILSGHPLDCTHMPEISYTKEQIIIAVGRFSDPRKNILMLLNVFEKIYKELPETKLFIIGKKPEDIIINKFNNFISHKNIIFTGQLGSQELIEFYKKASLMLITSYQEGFCISGLEALFYGVPVISTLSGGPQDYVIDNLTGFNVNINDDTLMSKYSIELLKDPDKRFNFSQNGQNFVKNNFSKEKIYAQFQQGLSVIYPELSFIFKEYLKHNESSCNKSHLYF